LQAGAEHQDLVLLMNPQGADELKSGHWDLGAEASAAGPGGGKAATESTGWKAPVLSYSNASGAFAGADVGASKIGADKDTIHNVYGRILRSKLSLTAKCNRQRLHKSFCLPCSRWT